MRMGRVDVFTVLVACLVFPQASSCAAAHTQDVNAMPDEAARDFLKQQLEGGELPGIQYLVLDEQGTVFEFNGGLRDVARRAPVTADTTFMSSSTTKVVTALAVLQLADRGLVELDGSLSDYAPDHHYGDDPTVRQLIAHTAGVPNPLPLDWLHPAEDHDSFDEGAELARVLADNPELKSDPGSKYRYSNLGYWLLARVIESASGQSYCDYVSENILRPLDIAPTELGCTIPDPDIHATGYVKRFSLTRAMLGIMAPGFVFGESAEGWTGFAALYMNGPSYGGLIGNARGWSKLLADQLGDRSKVMSESAKRRFYEKQRTADGEESGTTLGWHTGVLEGHAYYSKPGGGPGFSSNVRVYPDRGIATVWLSNRMQMTEGPIQELSDAIDAFFLR